METYRLIHDGILADWEKRYAELPEKVLRNLFYSDNPSQLDDLFWLEDNREDISHDKPSIQVDWSNEPTAQTIQQEYTDSMNESIIHQFILQSNIEIDEYFSRDSFRQLLSDFLRESPLNTLQTPARIQSALERLFVRESNLGLTSRRKKINRRCIREFLIYLNKRNLVGPLPALRHKAQSLVNRFVKAMSETKTAVAVLGVSIYFVTFILLSLTITNPTPVLHSGYGVYFEALIFGGLLNANAFTAPGFGSLIVSLLLMHALLLGKVGAIRGIGLETHIALIVQIYLSWLIIDWNYGSATLLSTFLSISLFLCVVLYSRITQAITWSVENETGISLISFWLCYTSLFVTLPVILSSTSDYIINLGFAFVLICLFMGQRIINNAEIGIESTRIIDAHLNKEDISSSIKVEGDIGIKPHIFALIMSISGFELCNAIYVVSYNNGTMPWYFQYIPAATYLLTILTMNWIAITQKFSPALWDSRLNLKHQLIKGVKSTSERNKLLARLRFSLLLKEQMFIILIVAISVLWMRNQLDVETGFPLSIFLLFTTYLFFYYVRDASLKTYKLLLSRSPISQEVLDLPLIKDQSDNVNFWERLNNILRNRISLILTILIIVIQVLTVIVRGWDFIKMLGK